MSEGGGIVSRGSRLLSQKSAVRNNKCSKEASVRQPSRLTAGVSKKTQDDKPQSTVQMIELELPNLHVDESKVSPQRVKVLSREFESENATAERDEDLRAPENASAREGSDIQSEADILRGMAATMRTSQNWAKAQGSQPNMDIQAGGNIVHDTSGMLPMSEAHP